jgi:hypothetical protein
MRRQAKTPVFRIGQLEGNKSRGAGDRTKFGRGPWIAQKTSSVELIAEQYCAFLEHRDALNEERERLMEGRQDNKIEKDSESSTYDGSSIHTAYHPDVATFRPHSPLAISREHLSRESPDETPTNIILEPVRSSTLIPQHSPTSTNGTYVGCDEDAIYFKPVALPHCQPAQETHVGDYASPPVDDQIESADSLSLRICLDLLIRELSSAFTDRLSRTGDPAAMQLWVMIEAYEGLQNRIACMDELSESHRQNVEVMLQSWLGTLYEVHDLMSSKPAIDQRLVERLSEDVD